MDKLSPEELERKDRVFKLIELWKEATLAEKNFETDNNEIFAACRVILLMLLDTTYTSVPDAKRIFEEMLEMYIVITNAKQPSSSSEGSPVDQPERLGS